MTVHTPTRLIPTWRGAASRNRLLVGIAVVTPIVVFLVMAWHRRWLADDAFINLRVVKQIEAGHGPVYNAGERVEAVTSPLWILLLLVGDLLLPLRLEWIAVLEGLVLSATGLWLACTGAASVSRTFSTQGRILPFGLLIIVALPPMWDFATSGLENGLTLLWIGLTFFLIARVGCPREALPGAKDRTPRSATGSTTTAPRVRRGATLAALAVGLGPLVRPDFVVLSAAFLGALLFVLPAWPDRIRATAWALTFPVVYEVFRMGYYAALVPNTAIAKEGTLSWWPQGFRYLGDFATPYRLWLPFAAVACVLVWLTYHAETPRSLILIWLPIAGGVLHALLVVRAGGDFMHGRMLLPSVIMICVPIAVVRARGWMLIPIAVVGIWALLCATSWRWLADPALSSAGLGIVDEADYWRTATGSSNPILVEDFAAIYYSPIATADRALAKQDPRVFLVRGAHGYSIAELQKTNPLKARARYPLVAEYVSIGGIGYLAGTDIYIDDFLGLASPLASRIRLPVPRTGRPGHEKDLPETWGRARFVRPSVALRDRETIAAHRALDCPDLKDLLGATRGDLDFSRFVTNIVRSAEFTQLRFPADPIAAERELC